MVTLRVGNADYWFALKKINANGAGRYNVPALFSEGFFSMKKGVWWSEIYRIRKIAPGTQATFKSPSLSGLTFNPIINETISTHFLVFEAFECK